MESNSICNHTSDFCLITSMTRDRIERHDELLPIYHNLNKIYDIYKALFKIKTKEIPRYFC